MLRKYNFPILNVYGEVLCFFRDMTYDEERELYINQTNFEDSTNKLNLIGFWYALIVAIIVLCIIMFTDLLRRIKKMEN